MSKVLLEDYPTEKLERQVKTCKILRIIFIVGGILLTLGGCALIVLGFIYGFAAVLAIIFSAGYADVSDIANQGAPAFVSGLVMFPIGLAVLIAGSIVTTVKIRNRRAILDLRGDFE